MVVVDDGGLHTRVGAVFVAAAAGQGRSRRGGLHVHGVDAEGAGVVVDGHCCYLIGGGVERRDVGSDVVI